MGDSDDCWVVVISGDVRAADNFIFINGCCVGSCVGNDVLGGLILRNCCSEVGGGWQ